MKKLIVTYLVGIFLISCKSTSDSYERFLVAADPKVQAWLNEKVSVTMVDQQLTELRTFQAFRNINLLLDGRQAKLEPISLDVDNITRKEFFWKVHKQTGLEVDVVYLRGQSFIRIRSKEVADIKGNAI
ncbi:MAG: hypothetical protein MK193_00380 [Lentisphaeria bacterium]|nr:hypothetical protein [Lentisphaeria bacterium]